MVKGLVLGGGGRGALCAALAAVVGAGCLVDEDGGSRASEAIGEGSGADGPTSAGTHAPSDLAGCYVYVLQKDRGGSRLVRIDLRQRRLEPVGDRYDVRLVALAIHPTERVLYATSDRTPSSHLYRIDAHTGELTRIGDTGVAHVAGLTFRPTDRVLWGSTPDGLVTIDPETARVSFVTSVTGAAGDIAWTPDGTKLLGGAGRRLWTYEPGATGRSRPVELAIATEAFEMRNDGRLIAAPSRNGSSSGVLHVLDLGARRSVSEYDVADRLAHVEDVAWLGACGLPSPGGAADLIQAVRVDPMRICSGDTVRVSVDTLHPDGDELPVDVSIQGQMGEPQYVQLTGRPGPRRITVVASTADQYVDHEVVEVEVVPCDGQPPRPVVYVSPNPYREHWVDFEVANAGELGDVTSYEWELGDGATVHTRDPYVSHDYAGSLERDALYTVVEATLRVRRASGGDVVTRKTLSLTNIYAFNKRRGVLMPPVTGPDELATSGSSLTGSFTVTNLEDEPIDFAHRWVEHVPCDPEMDPTAEDVEAIAVRVDGGAVHTETVEVPATLRDDLFCGVSVHLTGNDARGRHVVASAYFEVQDNPLMRVAIEDPERLAILEHVAGTGLVPDPDRITDEELYALAKAGHIDYPHAGPPVLTALQDPGEDALGERCDPDDGGPPRPGVTCQATEEWELVQPHIANARKGDVLLSAGCGMIGKLLRRVSLPQQFSHSGLMTRSYYEVHHSTGAEDRYQDYPVGVLGGPTDGFREDVLKYGWPGVIDQSIDEAYNGQWMVDPESGDEYLVSAFIPHPRLCAGDTALIYPRVLRPLPIAGPQDEVRRLLRDAVSEMMLLHGHYRFYAYTDAAIGLGGDHDAPGSAGWAATSKPTVCSSSIWMSLRNASIAPEGPEIEVFDYELGARADDETEDGLYYYDEVERKAGGDLVHSYVYDAAYEEGGWLVRLFTDAPDDIANQLVNCFASDDCSEDAKDSEAWRAPGPGRAVSPQDMLFWDAPPAGVYGHNEPLAYRTGRFVRVYRWAPSEGSGEIAGRVVDGSGVPAAGADVTVTTLDVHHVTAFDGTFDFVAVPEGTHEVVAQKWIGGLLWEATELVTVGAGATTNVELVLGPPPRNNRRVVISGSMEMVDHESVGADERDIVEIYEVLDVNPVTTRASTSMSACVGDELVVQVDFEARLLDDNTSVETYVEARMYEQTDCDPTDREDTETALVTVPEDGSEPVSLHLYNDEVDGGDTADIEVTVTNGRQP